MDGKFDLITIISLVVAVVVIIKLRSVLGKRTGDEEGRLERARLERQRTAASSEDKVVTLPRRDRERPEPASAQTASQVSEAEATERIKTFAGSDQRVAAGLLEILRLDNTFDPEHFVRGAKQAYEMIVTGFAEGNRKLPKDLLSREVFEGFVAAIAEREQKGEQIDQSFVGILKSDIVEAELKGGVAHITVRFVSQLISATRERGGTVVAGDPQKVREVTDVWTFSRDISSARARQNPNWKLVATQPEA
jgi:predicted lipid-binding transport protein (Tim44 family)